MVQRHYRGEADKDVFYRIPKMLFLHPRYQPMSIGAKVLYGLMLDRMGLSSTRERWIDKDGSIYIYFQQEEAMEMLNVKGTQKIVQLYKELEEADLIERVKQGFGKPDKIYVGKIEIYSEPEEEPTPDFDFQKSREAEPDRVLKIETKGFENQNHEVLKIETLPNNIYANNLYSINQLTPGASATTGTPTKTAGSPTKEMVEEQVAAQIDKQGLQKKYPPNKATIDSIAALMVDELTSDRPTATIGGATRTRAEVRDRLSAVTPADVAAILDKMRRNPPKMSNPRGYLLTCLYNAPATRTDSRKKESGEVRKYADALMKRRNAAGKYAQALKEEMEGRETEGGDEELWKYAEELRERRAKKAQGKA